VECSKPRSMAQTSADSAGLRRMTMIHGMTLIGVLAWMVSRDEPTNGEPG
jgi:hypothetical protein